MKVLVFAKQIPDVNSIGFDPSTNRIIRENVPLQMNSFDRKAVEEALRIKEKYGWETAVATMGPPPSAEIINLSLMMGIDRGFLLTDRSFGGSDTLVTARILSSFVSYYKPDLVLMGKYSLDGETSQVPPELAKLCNFSFKSSISKLEIVGDVCTAEQDAERSIVTYELKLPAVISVSEKINRARAVKQGTPDMSGKVEIVDSKKLGIRISGVAESPTVVAGTERIESKRRVAFLGSGEKVYETALRIIKTRYAGDIEKVAVTEDGGRGIALGIAVSDSIVSMEIASKNFQLAQAEGLSTVMIGNIVPAELRRMPANRYVFLKESESRCIAEFIAEYIRKNRPKFVLYPSTVDGREIAAFVAAELGLGLTADCVDLRIENGKLIQYKPAFGGGIIARIYSKTDPQMATVRPGMLRRLESVSEFTVEEPDMVSCNSNVKRISVVEVPPQFKPLNQSRVIVAVGKGIRKPDNIKDAIQLADRLDASIGATRPIVDFGWIPRQQQIGLTGISISPDVYIAIGISGNDNHVVGTRYAKKIIAVNNDPNAPIFQYADYGIIADSMEFIKGFLEYLQTH
ncbi:MAG: FAD-binding protein [Candidatus Thermoplasmatota archaeon]|jgi:electron transfer flavoprotein alpha subunit|nr:FAD-binding protein [Candidatus Thermoplasmatota archaeon]MCL5667900.1 FAD-binding protein [Candidatus Thermoplasmatota archaeon]